MNNPNGQRVTTDMANVSSCKHCGQKVAWLISERTKKRYPVNFEGEINTDGRAVIIKKCLSPVPDAPEVGMSHKSTIKAEFIFLLPAIFFAGMLLAILTW